MVGVLVAWSVGLKFSTTFALSIGKLQLVTQQLFDQVRIQLMP